MDDLDHMALEVLLILGAFCLGAILGNRRTALPEPDSKTHRNFGEHR